MSDNNSTKYWVERKYKFTIVRFIYYIWKILFEYRQWSVVNPKVNQYINVLSNKTSMETKWNHKKYSSWMELWKEAKKQQEQIKKSVWVDANAAIWIITLNVNGLNHSCQKAEIYIKTRLNYALYIRNSLKYKA